MTKSYYIPSNTLHGDLRGDNNCLHTDRRLESHQIYLAPSSGVRYTSLLSMSTTQCSGRHIYLAPSSGVRYTSLLSMSTTQCSGRHIYLAPSSGVRYTSLLSMSTTQCSGRHIYLAPSSGVRYTSLLSMSTTQCSGWMPRPLSWMSCLSPASGPPTKVWSCNIKAIKYNVIALNNKQRIS